jgi:DNA-binding transcriptional regulator/RsmH inhibitor MraZ
MIQNTQLMLYQHDNDPKYTAQINKLKCHHKARLEFNRKFVGSAWQATE